jgi:hypothetical protein
LESTLDALIFTLKEKRTPWEQKRTIGESMAKSTSCTIGKGANSSKINQLFVDEYHSTFLGLALGH